MQWPVRLGALVLLVVTVLGYGFWCAWSRANITLLVLDVARDPVGVPTPVTELTLRDSAGTTLARHAATHALARSRSSIRSTVRAKRKTSPLPPPPTTGSNGIDASEKIQLAGKLRAASEHF